MCRDRRRAGARASTPAGGCGGDGGSDVAVTGDLPTMGSILFVVRGDARADDGRISIETDTVEWFSDRPKRQAGVSPIDQLADRWSEFGLAKTPPNDSVGPAGGSGGDAGLLGNGGDGGSGGTAAN